MRAGEQSGTEPQGRGPGSFLGARHRLEEEPAASLGCTKVSQAAALGRRDASRASVPGRAGAPAGGRLGKAWPVVPSEVLGLDADEV